MKESPLKGSMNNFNPQKNISFAVYLFRYYQQQTQETLDQFCTRLRERAAHCNFADKDSEIKQQIIQGCTSSKLRRRVLHEPQLSLQQLVVLKCQNCMPLQWNDGNSHSTAVSQLLIFKSLPPLIT